MSDDLGAIAFKHRVLGALAAGVIRILGATLRWHWIGVPSDAVGAWGEDQKIYAFWHGRMLMLPRPYKRAHRGTQRKLYVLISRHGDGRLIAYAMRLLGIDSVAGSSSSGGRAALRALTRRAREGADIGITPDGPRGPRNICKVGVVALAQLTGLPIYPLTYSAQRYWRFSSWDGMILPRPFSRVVVGMGDPIVIQPGDDLEAARIRIEEALNELTERTDRYWTAL